METMTWLVVCCDGAWNAPDVMDGLGPPPALERERLR